MSDSIEPDESLVPRNKFLNLMMLLLVMHRYEILPIFRLTDIAFAYIGRYR